MAAFLFFFGVPLFFGLLQFLVIRSSVSRGKKFIPLTVVGVVAAITWLGCFDVIPLPKTDLFDGSSFLAFPDYFYVAVFCFPALFGIGLGALFGVADFEHK